MTPSTDTNSTATTFLIATSFVRSCTSSVSLSAILSSGDALPVRFQAVGQLLRAAEGDEVPADVLPTLGDAPLGGEGSVSCSPHSLLAAAPENSSREEELTASDRR